MVGLYTLIRKELRIRWKNQRLIPYMVFQVAEKREVQWVVIPLFCFCKILSRLSNVYWRLYSAHARSICSMYLCLYVYVFMQNFAVIVRVSFRGCGKIVNFTWRLKSVEMWQCVGGPWGIRPSGSSILFLDAWRCRWRHYSHLKCWELLS